MGFNYPQINVPVAPVDNMQSMNYAQPMQQQMSPQAQHISDVLNEYVNSKTQQQSGNGIAEQILANRFQPNMQDIANSVTQTAQSYARPDLFKPIDPSGAMAQRYSNELSPYTDMLRNQMSAGTQYMNISGGGTGVLTNRMMQDNPGMTFTQAYNQVQANPALLRLGMQMQPGMGGQPSISAATGAPQAFNTMENAKTSGQEGAKLEYAGPIAQSTATAQESTKQKYAGPIAQATKMGEQAAENQQTGMASNDIIGLYGKLQQDAKTAPSGVIESGVARAANAMNMPTQGSVAQATFDADLNNLYLATIRSLKGTGRVMEQELNKIAESAPKDTDSMPVKIAKAQAHMQYYIQRMQSLGYDPNSGQPANQAGIAPVNSSQFNAPGTGGTPNPPTPVQIQQQMQGASHRYNPDTGTLEPIP